MLREEGDLLRMHWLWRFPEPSMFDVFNADLLTIDATQECESDGRVQSVEVVAWVLDVTQEGPGLEFQPDLRRCDPAHCFHHGFAKSHGASGNVPQARARFRCSFRQEDSYRSPDNHFRCEPGDLGIDLVELHLRKW